MKPVLMQAGVCANLYFFYIGLSIKCINVLITYMGATLIHWSFPLSPRNFK